MFYLLIFLLTQLKYNVALDYLVGPLPTEQLDSWIDMIRPHICFICTFRIQISC